jgi:hypothetical protein
MLIQGGTHDNPRGYISSMEQEGGERVLWKRLIKWGNSCLRLALQTDCGVHRQYGARGRRKRVRVRVRMEKEGGERGKGND